MGIDEALLNRWSGAPVLLRLYAWQPPGLSLGYFQRHAEMSGNAAARDSGAVITRRITGGDAILHFHELTFSIVGLDGSFPFDDTVESSYHRIHEALASGFSAFGLTAAVRKAGERTEYPQEGHQGRCFYAVTRYDLVCGERKLVGSAQRRTAGKVLHHGSIPLAPNPMTPESADLSTLSGRTITCDEAAAAVRRGVEDYFDVRLEEWPVDEAIIEEGRRLARSKYGAAVWVERR
jgi:lipoate-protein ligase A